MDHEHDGHDNDHDHFIFGNKRASELNQDRDSCVFDFLMIEQLEGSLEWCPSPTLITVLLIYDGLPEPCPLKLFSIFLFLTIVLLA